MKTFREQLAQIAYGQLVNRGHLSPELQETTGKRDRANRPAHAPPRVIRWPRLAMPH